MRHCYFVFQQLALAIFFKESFKHVWKILIEKKDDLETLAQGLLKYETLSGQEIHDLLAGKTIEKSTGCQRHPESDIRQSDILESI